MEKCSSSLLSQFLVPFISALLRPLMRLPTKFRSNTHSNLWSSPHKEKRVFAHVISREDIPTVHGCVWRELCSLTGTLLCQAFRLIFPVGVGAADVAVLHVVFLAEAHCCNRTVTLFVI